MKTAFIRIGKIVAEALLLELPEIPYVTADPQECPSRRIIERRKGVWAITTTATHLFSRLPNPTR